MVEKRKARELGPEDWILSHFSIQGASFEERVEAAAVAGFAGIGLLLFEYRRLRAEGLEVREMKQALDAHGLALAELDCIMGWGAEDHAPADALVETACEIAEAFQCRQLQVIGPFEGTIADAARRFARVCDRAAEVGLLVAIEFLPFTNIVDAGVALDIVERAGRPNGGVCVDVWHHFRGARDDALLRALPGERIVTVQISDGTREPRDSDYMRDCMENRMAPGEGEFDLAGFLELLAERGCRAPLSFEVISKELDALPPIEAARRIAAGAASLA